MPQFHLGQKYSVCNRLRERLKVVTSEKVGGSGVRSTLGTLYEGVVMGILLSFDEATILYGVLNILPHKSKI